MADQGGYGIGTIALIPVITVAYHDTYFGFAFSFINIIVPAVANVLTIQGIYSEPVSS